MESLLKYFWTKSLATVPACYLLVNQLHLDIIWGIVYIIMLDTILGIWVAIKFRIFSSHHLSRVFTKVGTYTIAMSSAWILSAVKPDMFGWVFHWLGIFVLITEFMSNMEKLALIGFKTPTLILSKINRQFNRFLEAGRCSDVAEDILKNRNGKV
jgi:hypothetical protein